MSEKFCSQCGAELASDAKYCHQCGWRLGSVFGMRWMLPIFLGAATALVIIFLVQLVRSESAARTAAQPPSGAGQPSAGGPPDLTQMSPRQAADRLFDRVMRASETGDQAEVNQFLPMAINAYYLIGPLDPDARYHLGTLFLADNNAEGALIQADSLNLDAPNHLFADLLRGRVYDAIESDAELRAAYQAFLDHEPAERALQRPEYQAHGVILRRFGQEARAALGS